MPIGINGSGTITGISAGGLPDGTIVQADLASGVAGNGPAFSAYQGSTSSISSSAATKVTFDIERFDTASCFASSRFTPNVAGYYSCHSTVTVNAGAAGTSLVYFYKNGTEYSRGLRVYVGMAALVGMPISDIIYFNGTTDYLEVYALTTGATSPTEAGGATFFSACMVRAA